MTFKQDQDGTLRDMRANSLKKNLDFHHPFFGDESDERILFGATATFFFSIAIE